MWKRYLAFSMTMMLVFHTVPMTAYAEENMGSAQGDTVVVESEETSASEKKVDDSGKKEQLDEEQGAEPEAVKQGQERLEENAGQVKSGESTGEEAEGSGADAGQEKLEENTEAEQEQSAENVGNEEKGEEFRDTEVTDEIENGELEEERMEMESDLLPIVNAVGNTGEYQPEGASYKLTYIEVDGGVKIRSITGTKEGELKIPVKIDGMDVVEIENRAFRDCSGLTGALTIPSSMKIIGEEAFLGCSNITDILIPESVEEIKSNAFAISNWGTEYFPQPIKITVYSKDAEIAQKAFGKQKFLYGYSGSTLEQYAAENSCAFGLIDEPSQISEYRVTNTDEFLNAIGSYRRIILADGVYEIIEKNYSGGVTLSGIVSLSIEAEHPGKAEILCKPGKDNNGNDGSGCFDPVITITTCEDIKINGLILGHDGEIGGCNQEAYVVGVVNASNILIDNCDLYGCGSIGVNCRTVNDVNINNSVVRDCQLHIAGGSSSSFRNGSDIKSFCFNGCIMSGHIGHTFGNYYYSALNCPNELHLTDCLLLNNCNPTFDDYNSTITNCKFYNNAWDGGTPQPSGICLNGITWQMDGTVLKFGFPLVLDNGTILSKTGKVMDYSASATPWKNCEFTEVQYAEGIESPGGGSEPDPGPGGDEENIAEGDYWKLKWVIDSKGKLTVSGEGDFAQGALTYDDPAYSDRAPWYDFRDKIKTAEINVQYMGDASWMFNDCNNLVSIDLSNFDTSRIFNMYGMFNDCKSLKSLDLSNFNTRSVHHMGNMFSGCESLTDLDLGSFNTSQVTEMDSMFSYCSSLLSLDLSTFDVSSVSRMDSMFWECSALTNLNLDNFNTSNQLMYIADMFSGCSSLVELDLSSFDGSGVRDFVSFFGDENTFSMFEGCTSLSTIYTPYNLMRRYQLPVDARDIWYQPDGTEITCLPTVCDSMVITRNKIPVISEPYIRATMRKTNYVCGDFIATNGLTVKYYSSDGTVKKVTDYTTNEDDIDMSTPGKKKLVVTYNGFTAEVELNVSSPLVASLTLSSDSLTLSVGETTTLKAEITSDHTVLPSVKWKCTDESVATVENGLVTAVSKGVCFIRASAGDKSAECFVTVTDAQTEDDIASGSYENIRWRIDANGKLTVEGSGEFSDSNATNRAPWYKNRSSIKSAEINLTGTTNASYMFNSCQNLTDIDVSKWDISKVTDMTGVFCGCSSLTSLDLSYLDVEKVTNFRGFFEGCYELSTIYVPCNLKMSVELPKSSILSRDIWYDIDGNSYTELPQNLTRSIVLTRNQKPVISAPHITVEKEKTNYVVGEKLNTDDLKVTYYNETGISSKVSDYTTNADEIDMSTAGTKTLVVTYRDLSAELKIVVSKKQTEETQGLKISFKNEQDKVSVYTGSAIQPEIRVSYNGRNLIEGINYTVKYTNNIKAGNAMITVTGKGNFRSSKYERFEIVQADIANAAFAGTDKEGRLVVVSGTKFAPIIYCGNRKLTTNDYSISGMVKAGDKITDSDSNKVITLSGRGNYTGNKKITLRVVRKSELSKFTVTLDKTRLNALTYDGKAHYVHEIQGTVTVLGKDGNANMKQGVDYIIVYPANVTDAGVKKFSVVGMGLYTGTVSKSYTIKPAVNTNNVLKVAYESGNIENIKLPYRSTGVTFNDKIKITYSKGGDAFTLREGKDYKVTYNGNKKVGSSAKFTITFLGNYKGIQKQTRTFTIEKADLKDTTVVIADAVYKKNPGIYKSVPYVIEAETGRLIKASNYNATYYIDKNRNIEMKGKNKVSSGDTVYVKLEAKANSNYKSDMPLIKTYQVTNAINLAKTKITFISAATGSATKAAEYTGNKITERDIKVLINGKPADENVVITYANNIDKGKATVIITGTGKPGCKYTGCKKATFNIVAYSLR